ncbi:MAG: SdrD B-like domain-containing protein, partial [Bacteroidota bacterium]
MGENIVITTDNGASQSFMPSGTAGMQIFTLTGLTSDGVSDIDVTATFETTTSCTDELADAYDAPADCSPVCSITVNSASPSTCVPSTNEYTLDVEVTYSDAPMGENIVITTDNGASQSFMPSGAAGMQIFTLTGLTSDGVSDIGVTATFETTTSCTDDLIDAYDAPADCTPCSITVNSATASDCESATNAYTLDVSITYNAAPMGESIIITTDNGASQSFMPSGTMGMQTFTLTGLTSDGMSNIDVTATFASTTTCTSDLADAYDAPENCLPVSVGDTAFVDINEDGLQTPGEPGIGGVTVVLTDSNSGDTVMVDVEGNPITGITTTDPDGFYEFTNLPPGDYTVLFDISTADNGDFYTFTTPDAGDDALDSDAQPITSTTATSSPTGFLPSGSNDPTLDVGLVCNLQVTVSDPAIICGGQSIDLTQGASISPGSLGGSWSTPDGSISGFDNGTDFSTATTYT